LAINLQALPVKDKEIVLICDSGHRSAIGMAVLQMLGYKKAKSLAGGVSVIKIVDGGSITIIDGRSGGLPVLSRFRMVVPFATLWGRNREPVFVDYESAGLRV
jgi:hypothetical protein